jgi:hypothetical protein
MCQHESNGLRDTGFDYSWSGIILNSTRRPKIYTVSRWSFSDDRFPRAVATPVAYKALHYGATKWFQNSWVGYWRVLFALVSVTATANGQERAQLLCPSVVCCALGNSWCSNTEPADKLQANNNVALQSCALWSPRSTGCFVNHYKCLKLEMALTVYATEIFNTVHIISFSNAKNEVNMINKDSDAENNRTN